MQPWLPNEHRRIETRVTHGGHSPAGPGKSVPCRPRVSEEPMNRAKVSGFDLLSSTNSNLLLKAARGRTQVPPATIPSKPKGLSMKPLRYQRAFFTVALLLLFGMPQHVNAQGVGTVTGTITDARTGGPVAGAQISVRDRGLGVLSTESGRFLLINLPEGRL